jgi:hypothetical protein
MRHSPKVEVPLCRWRLFCSKIVPMTRGACWSDQDVCLYRDVCLPHRLARRDDCDAHGRCLTKAGGSHHQSVRLQQFSIILRWPAQRPASFGQGISEMSDAMGSLADSLLGRYGFEAWQKEDIKRGRCASWGGS